MADAMARPERRLAEGIARFRGRRTGADAALLRAIGDLGHTIAAARDEIASLCVRDINGSHIPSATDELDAIVAHTASATNTILESCEMLDAIAPMVDSVAAAKLQDAATRIYEACSFQDITGQRIGKVVSTLKAIEAKVATITATFSGHAAPPLPVFPDAGLLNGPQLPASAMSQTSIDRLLSESDR